MVCTDTGVLLLALNFAEQLPFYTTFMALSYDACIGFAYTALGERICEGILFLHAITGSDKNGKFAGKGKLMWFKKFFEYNDESLDEQMDIFGKESTISDEFIAAISLFIAYVYTGKQVTSKARWILFTEQREKICRQPHQRSTSIVFEHIGRRTNGSVLQKISRVN